MRVLPRASLDVSLIVVYVCCLYSDSCRTLSKVEEIRKSSLFTSPWFALSSSSSEHLSTQFHTLKLISCSSMAGTRPCTTICHATKTSWSWKRATLWMWWRSVTTAGLSVRSRLLVAVVHEKARVVSILFWSWLISLLEKIVFFFAHWRGEYSFYRHAHTLTARGHCGPKHTVCLTSASAPSWHSS